MNDRREPTISTGAVDSDSHGANRRDGAARSAARSGSNYSRGNVPSSRPVTSSSPLLGTLAILLALVACGGAGFIYWQFMQFKNNLVVAESRIKELEQKLTLSGDESSQSLATLQLSLKEAHSEIKKLWGVSYDTNRKAIAANKGQIASSEKRIATGDSKIEKKLLDLSSNVSVVSELVDAQQNVINRVDQSNASATAQARAINEKVAKLEQTMGITNKKVSDAEKDIEAINGFRRSVNQQLLEIKNRAASP